MMPSITNTSLSCYKTVTKMTTETLTNVNSTTVSKNKKTFGLLNTAQLISQLCVVKVTMTNVVQSPVVFPV